MPGPVLQTDICSNCHKRKATENWVGDGGWMAYSHGMYSRWCKICVLEAQIASIRKSMNRLPTLEAKLKKLKR
jgi:hypothetical protein